MNRNINADLIKSISIIGVVFIHAYTIFGPVNNLLFVEDLFRSSVPCFIILWALFFEKSFSKKNKQQQRKYVISKLIYLFRVYLIWSVIYFLIQVEWEQLNFRNLITKYFSGYGWSGQYFFIVLFQLIILYPLIRTLYNNKALRILTYICSITIFVYFEFNLKNIPEIIQKLGSRPFYFWTPYVFVGIILAREKINSISPWLILSPFLISIEFYINRSLNLFHYSYITLGTLIFSILYCISLYKIKLNIHAKFEKIITFIGNNTLIIFVSNPLIIILVEKYTDTFYISDDFLCLPIGQKLLISFFSVISVFLCTLLIIKFLQKSKLIKIFG